MPKPKREEPVELSWEPVLHGGKYCAPACGRGCTYSEYLDAEQKAKDLAARLGPEWKIRVSENLGWHYNAYCGNIAVNEGKHGDNPTYYTAYVGDHFDGMSGGYWVEHGDTPQEAVENALLAATAAVEHKAGLLMMAKMVAAKMRSV